MRTAPRFFQPVKMPSPVKYAMPAKRGLMRGMGESIASVDIGDTDIASQFKEIITKLRLGRISLGRLIRSKMEEAQRVIDAAYSGGSQDEISPRLSEIDELMMVNLKTEEQEDQAISDYSDFRRTSTFKFPTADEILAGVMQLEIMPTIADQAALVASVPQGAYLVDPSSDTGPLMTDLSVAQQDVSVQAEPKVKKVYVYAGLAALIYWLLGGKQ